MSGCQLCNPLGSQRLGSGFSGWVFFGTRLVRRRLLGRIFSRSLGSPPAAVPRSPASRWHPGAAVPARTPPSPPCLAAGPPPARLRLQRSGAGLGSPLLCQQCCGCPAPGLRLEPCRGPGFAQQPGRGDSTGPRCGSHVPCVAGQGLAPLLAHTGWRQRCCLHACFPPCPLILRPLSAFIATLTRAPSIPVLSALQPHPPQLPPHPPRPPPPRSSPSLPSPCAPHPPPRPLSRSPGGHRSHRPRQAAGEGPGAGRRPRGRLCPGLSVPASFLLYRKAGNFSRAKAGPRGFNGVARGAAAGAQDPPGTSRALAAGCGAVGTSARDAQEPGGVAVLQPQLCSLLPAWC